jgi:RNA polymerase sigma-70 factor (ECF subfamily)
MDGDATTQLQDLIQRMRAGEAGVRDELLARAGARLRRLTHKMLQDFPRVRRWEQTEDVLQNALLRLLRALQAVPITSVAEFFHLAARHLRWELVDLARHYSEPQGLAAHHASNAAGNTASGQPPAQDPPDSSLEAGRLAVWSEFHQSVERLPEEERTVFDLLWYQGLTQAEAAALLDVSVPTVKRRWLSARLRLKAALGGEAFL